MVDENASKTEIDAEPTKAFFIDMLTRDIPLDQAILDLVDNSVDGAKALKAKGRPDFNGLWVQISFDAEQFKIVDNCGGFDRDAARSYAFRFGRPGGAKRTPHSIGQFGVGMKRALFKFGTHFKVHSATSNDSWSVEVPVSTWEQEKGWAFQLRDLQPGSLVSTDQPGTEITVSELREEVSAKFALKNFETSIFNFIKSKHRQFISEGLAISVNGRHIDATNLLLLVSDGLRPGIENIRFSRPGRADVTVRIIVAIGQSSPKQAGWYVVCNGRVVLEADRSPVTGWGVIEDAANRIIIPSYHNQFARFRGLVFFDSEDSSRVPWNTTKTGVDEDSSVWVAAMKRMMEMMRPAIDFLNELDADIDEFSREESPLSNFVAKAELVSAETLTVKSAFVAPKRGDIVKGPKLVKIQYSRPLDDVVILQEALDLSSAKAVGEATFDAALKRQKR
ncbi:ATP-binding protein [Tianweitania sediminis]|uniref:ATP-binding protein n=1 Tax=Tianweitania sediminis TaxID=1502156 RepID=A0A8J7R321_9HYPH|nr:ATP-binding protein [Tianweitania sediminis]MBP0439561.1 ATP-binding protein [Tianweitania sediminis]